MPGIKAVNYDFDLGNWTRPVTTRSEDAQWWFDRGLNWTYAYNHEEAVACFHKAIEADPDCAMAWWGVAYAGGPFYNRPWIRYAAAEIETVLPACFQGIRKALAKVTHCSSAERSLIEALALRYQTADERDTATLTGWQFDYADAMRQASEAQPDDSDVAALYIEAAVTCTPRQLWNLSTGEMKPEARTAEVMPVMEHWMARLEGEGPVHPGIAHMFIHAMEMSPTPERALKAADMLVGRAPDAGHLEHMAAHIYVLCGDYAQSVRQSERAVRADDRYLAYAGDRNFYTTARCHDLHLFMFAAMFLGQYSKAMYAADRIGAMATPDLIADSPPFMASILDGYAAMRIHVLVRFGMWQELIGMPALEARELRPIGSAMHAYGRGVAHSALGNIDEARTAQQELREARDRIPLEAIFLSNTIHNMLAVADAMLQGELEYRRGSFDAAFTSLRLAVERDDNLNYTEPWAWMHPPRHALGALLAEQGRFGEAETVFRQDLGLVSGLPRCCQHPDNIWALQGLVECLEQREASDELTILKQRLALARQRADVVIESACFCRTSRGCC